MEATELLTIEQLREMHPADLADHLQRLPNEEAVQALDQLPAKFAALALGELEMEKAEELMEGLSDDRLHHLFTELPNQDTVDLLGHLDPDRRQQILGSIQPEKAEELRALLRHPEDTAGGIMSDRFIAIRQEMTLAQVLESLRQRPTGAYEEVAYLYVTDRWRRLVGIISIRDLVFRASDSLVGETMNPEVKFVRVDMDQEELARQFEHYHYLGLPVVDEKHRLVGLVKASDILQVAKEEATEDMQLMVGLSGEERALTPWTRSIAKRLPWLYVNLATALLAAVVVSLFEDTIHKWTALAVFLPIIAGQGGNAGMQTLTVIIRDMALGELSRGDGRKALIKELMVGMVNGIAIGIVVGLIGWAWKGSPELGLVAGAAMLLNQLAAAFSGVLIPFGLKQMNLDPALASSIFLTTVTDVAGFFFFLALGAAALHLFG